MIENNPKLTVKIGDGIGFMAEAEDYYDVIIVDCSDQSVLVKVYLLKSSIKYIKSS